MINQRIQDSFKALSIADRLALLKDLLADLELTVAQSLHQPTVPVSPIADLDWLPEDPFQELPTAAQLHGHHSIDSLRLLDATDFLRGLLRKHGYIREQPSFEQLVQTLRAEEAQLIRRRTKPAWAEWVARDGSAIDGPKDREWKDWVV
jgi:hypothetical protein